MKKRLAAWNLPKEPATEKECIDPKNFLNFVSMENSISTNRTGHSRIDPSEKSRMNIWKIKTVFYGSINCLQPVAILIWQNIWKVSKMSISILNETEERNTRANNDNSAKRRHINYDYAYAIWVFPFYLSGLKLSTNYTMYTWLIAMVTAPSSCFLFLQRCKRT